jgi:hypothetical protein
MVMLVAVATPEQLLPEMTHAQPLSDTPLSDLFAGASVLLDGNGETEFWQQRPLQVGVPDDTRNGLTARFRNYGEIELDEQQRGEFELHGQLAVARVDDERILLLLGYAAEETEWDQMTFEAVASSLEFFEPGIALGERLADLEGGFSYRMPAGWSRLPGTTGQVSLYSDPATGKRIIIHVKVGTPEQVLPEMNQAQSLSNTALSDLLTEASATLSHLTDGNIQLSNQRPTTVGGPDGLHDGLTARADSDGNQTLRGQLVVARLDDERMVVVLGASSSDTGWHQASFEAVVASLEFFAPGGGYFNENGRFWVAIPNGWNVQSGTAGEALLTSDMIGGMRIWVLAGTPELVLPGLTEPLTLRDTTLSDLLNTVPSGLPNMADVQLSQPEAVQISFPVIEGLTARVESKSRPDMRQLTVARLDDERMLVLLGMAEDIDWDQVIFDAVAGSLRFVNLEEATPEAQPTPTDE